MPTVGQTADGSLEQRQSPRKSDQRHGRLIIGPPGQVGVRLDQCAAAEQAKSDAAARAGDASASWPLPAPSPSSSWSPQRPLRPPCAEAEAASAAGRPWLGVGRTLAADPGGRGRTLVPGSGVGGPDPDRRGGGPRQADPAPAQL